MISPGALIRDNYDRLGIVLWESPVPKQHKMSYFTLIRVFPALADSMPEPELQ